MKRRNYILGFGAMVFAFLLAFQQNGHGQMRPAISIGVGMPELLHMGIRFPFNEIQFGISYGRSTGLVFESENPPSSCFAADLRYYFGGKSKFSQRKPWYGKMGLCFYKSENNTYINEYTYFNPRIGREINFTKQFGFELDLGVIIELEHHETRKIPPSLWEFGPLFHFPVLPSLSTSLFYRL